ncbi:MAG: rhodanese-related sulfurtransferase [Piptocephalis tieghemiana]|nr:MAG: rhodanese-related sulfurtransferase [Piptocephalis tieghemiana]
MLRLGLSKTRLSKGLPRSIWLLSSKQSPVTSQVRGWKGSLGQGDLRSHWLGVSYPCPRFHNPYSTATLPLTSEVREEDSSECLPPSHEYYTLSFYRFTPLPPEHCEDLRALFYQALDTLGVVGRIYLAAEGINAQISCPSSHFDALRAWCDHQDPPAITSTLAQLKQNLVSNIRFNWATKHGRSFDELDIRVRKYLVSDGLDPASYDLTLAPTYLSPEEWHRELSQLPSSSSSPDAPLLIDMRNHYESEIGHFEGALRPDVDTFREELVQVQRLAEENPRRTIYMYCTGGIRCSKAGAILRSKGCEDVRALDGGITAYANYIAEQSPRLRSLYRGSNFTFDRRLGEPVTPEEIISSCHQCGAPCDTYTNCPNGRCNLLFLQCPPCAARHRGTCGNPICLRVLEGEEEAQKINMDKTFSRSRGRSREVMRKWPVVIHNHFEKTRPRDIFKRECMKGIQSPVDTGKK